MLLFMFKRLGVFEFLIVFFNLFLEFFIIVYEFMRIEIILIYGILLELNILFNVFNKDDVFIVISLIEVKCFKIICFLDLRK